ncbi:MAG: hypothetical protein JW706_05245 [Opitutales bacterium]|nr:hypothetical protein [Opitutales bacterium]
MTPLSKLTGSSISVFEAPDARLRLRLEAPPAFVPMLVDEVNVFSGDVTALALSFDS